MYGYKEIDVSTLRQWRDSGRGFRLLDVRTPAETARGVISGAALLPLHLLPLKVQEMDADEPLVIYCRTGARSGQACAFLTQHGLSEVYNLRGGIVSWVESGFDVHSPEITAAETASIS